MVVSYQKKVEIEYGGAVHGFHGRTLEEAFVYENQRLFSSGALSIGKEIPADAAEFHQVVWERIKSSTFKKTEFAMDVLAHEPDDDDASWAVPEYVAVGLRWLEGRVGDQPVAGEQNA